MPIQKILLAEDDPAIREGLIDTLESEHYEVFAAENGREAFELYTTCAPDLVMLDIMMPEMSGYDVCREIRKTDPRTPIMMLTAKGEELDKVLGLELGADDYVTKPFGVRELLARVHALLRRGQQERAMPDTNSKERFRFGGCTVDPSTYECINGDSPHPLTQRELTLLRVFDERPNEVLSRDELLNAVWGINYYGTTRTLDQHIAQLRKKIEKDAKAPETLLTVHGVGYRYRPSC